MGSVLKVSPWVTHERLDDEVIAIDMERGTYFALDDVAADCWTLVAAGVPVDEVVDALSRRYGAGRDQVRPDVLDLVGELEKERLLVRDGSEDGADGSVQLPPPAEGRSYAKPTVTKFDDLQELLLLDPIHEVDKAGWPIARIN